MAAGIVLFLMGALLTGNLWLWILLGAFVLARFAYYVVRLAPGLRRILTGTARALGESVAGAPLGIASDFAYTVGLVTGVLRWAFGRPL